MVPLVPLGQQPPLNWSHFKPEFAGKAEHDADSHLLHTTGLDGNPNIIEQVKVQTFCLTLVGEARLWYESLRPIAINWEELQDQFRQQYPKIGNMTEQLFHVRRSFHYDGNVETVDAYVTCIRQVAAL